LETFEGIDSKIIEPNVEINNLKKEFNQMDLNTSFATGTVTTDYAISSVI
jgi:hypothetical protein